ncbi:MAG: vWA domain-containing protein, partial [Alphaproteobacteria bacterium]
INTDDLLQYLYSSFNSGVIFKEEGLDKLIPMLFEPAQKNTGSDTFNGHINLILDISGSMGNVSEEYIKKIKELVQTIKESVHSQTLTTFNHKITSYTFNLDDMLDRVRLNLLIDGLEMGGGTDLYGALNDALAAQEKTRSSLTLFITDGYHTEGSTSLDQLNPLNPQATPQAELVLLGFGNYDKVLFQDIARKTGLIHHYLDSLSELPEMEQYISQLGYKKIAYEFLKESERAFIERVPEGSVSISDNEVDRSYLARVIGDSAESYSIIASNLEENQNILYVLENHFSTINLVQPSYPEPLNSNELDAQIPEGWREQSSVFEWHMGNPHDSSADNTLQLMHNVIDHLNDRTPYGYLVIGYNHIVPIIMHEGSVYIIEGIGLGHALSTNLQSIFNLFEIRSHILNTGIQDNNHVNECGHIAISALSAVLYLLEDEDTQQFDINILREEVTRNFIEFYDNNTTKTFHAEDLAFVNPITEVALTGMSANYDNYDKETH